MGIHCNYQDAEQPPYQYHRLQQPKKGSGSIIEMFYNGLTNTIAYDSDLRPTSISVPNVESLAFSYDAANRLTGITNGLDSSMTQTLGYDALNRLTDVSSGADNASYQYDADGNRIHQVVNGTAVTFNPDTASNRLLSMTSGGSTVNYSYDPEGDILGYGPGTPTQMFAYTGFDRLNGSDVNGLSTHYDVNPEGQRLRKYTADTMTFFAPDASGALMSEDQDGTWMDYVWLNGRLVTVVANGGVYPVAADQTGRPLALTHPATQAILWESQGLPFDRGATTNHWGGFNLGFPGQYYDGEDGLWYNGNRDYDAALGRYIESDPIGLAGGVNTYAYVGNNSISNVDPLGLCYDKQKCAQASAAGAALGQQISSAGSVTSWTGIGLVGASGIAGLLAPEGAPAELEAGEYGVGLIEEGGWVSSFGAAVQGYARDGVTGALEDGGASAMVGFANRAYAGWLFQAAGHIGVGGIAGLLDKATEALKVEAAACTDQ
jgi:RHS repeat-associated protein